MLARNKTKVQVTLVRNPFRTSERELAELDVGMSVQGMLDHLWPTNARHNVHTEIDGKRIPAELRKHTRPKGGSLLCINAVPQGNGVKRALGFVLAIAAFAIPGGQAFSAAWFLKVGLSAVGMLIAASAGQPKLGTSRGSLGNSDPPNYSIAGVRNQMNPYGAVPRVYGRMKIYPPFAAKPYTRSGGMAQYLYSLFCLGYGPLAVSNVRIGSTPISKFKDVTTSLVNGWPDDEHPGIVFKDASQEDLSILLSVAGGAATRFTADDTRSIGLTFGFAQGLVEFDERNGQRNPHSVTWQVRYRLAGTTTWKTSGLTGDGITQASVRAETLVTSAPGVQTFSLSEVTNGRIYVQINTTFINRPDRQYRISLRRSGTTRWGDVEVVPATKGYYSEGNPEAVFDLSMYRILSGGTTTNFVAVGNNRFVGLDVQPGYAYDVKIETMGGTWTFVTGGIYVQTSVGGEITATAHKTNVVYKGVIIYAGEPGSYEVECKRLTPDNTDNRVRDELTWGAITSFQDNELITTLGTHAFYAMKIRANEQLNGVIDTLSMVVQSYLRVRDEDTGVFTWTLTRNPAWVFVDILTGSANPKPMADDQLDWESIHTWADYCARRNYYCDVVVDSQMTMADLLQQVCSVGMARLLIRDGSKYGVAIDMPKTVVVQHITPSNSWDYKGGKAFIDVPHAYKVRHYDAALNWVMTEFEVYRDGYNAKNATKFEVMELFGITTRTHAWRMARRRMASLILRPEVQQVTMDIENIVLEPGDLVLFTHDVPLIGSMPGSRISEVIVDGGGNVVELVTPEILTMTADKDWAIRLRVGADSFIAYPDSMDYVGNSLYFTVNPIPPGSAPDVGDLMIYGERGYETQEMIVHTISPRPDMSAIITMYDYAPDVFQAEESTFQIPDYDPRITTPLLARDVPLPQPRLVTFAAGEDELLEDASGMHRIRAMFSFAYTRADGNIFVVDPMSLQVQHRLAGEDDDQWTEAASVTGGAELVYITGVEEGYNYDFRARTTTATGRVSRWTYMMNLYVEGATAPPGDLDTLFLEGTNVSWVYSDPPPDLAGIEIRYNAGANVDWEGAIIPHNGVLSYPPFSISEIGLSGAVTILAKAKDFGGRYSVNAASLAYNMGDIIPDNLVHTEDYQAASYPGVMIGCSNVSTRVDADQYASADESPMYFDDNAKFYDDDADARYGQLYKTMVYEALYTPTSDLVPDGILQLVAAVVGKAYKIEYYIEPAIPMYTDDADPMYPGPTDADYMYTPLDGIAGTVFKPWPGSVTPISENIYHIKITVLGGVDQGQITDFKVLVDVPDIEENFTDIAIAAGTGTRLTLTKTYRVIDSIQLTRQNVGTGVEAVYDDKQANPGAAGGPLIRVRDAALASVAGTISARIKGH